MVLAWGRALRLGQRWMRAGQSKWIRRLLESVEPGPVLARRLIELKQTKRKLDIALLDYTYFRNNSRSDVVHSLRSKK